MKIICDFCKKESDKPSGEVNRAKNAGLKIYCDRRCSGLGRRKHKTKTQKVEEKRLYDMEYRERNMERILREKREHYLRTRDPEKEREVRKKRMHLHVAYCRRPEYKRWKKQYDEEYRAKKDYGEFWESFILALNIRNEALSRMTDYEIRISNGTLNKLQQRKRAYARLDRAEPEIGPLGDIKRGQRR